MISVAQAIMGIVPEEKAFKIRARVLPMDIDSLYAGLSAEVRGTAFEGRRNFEILMPI